MSFLVSWYAFAAKALRPRCARGLQRPTQPTRKAPKPRGRPHQTVLETHVVVGLLGNPNCLLQGELCLLTNDRLNINIPSTITKKQTHGRRRPRGHTSEAVATWGSCSQSWAAGETGQALPKPNRYCKGQEQALVCAPKCLFWLLLLRRGIKRSKLFISFPMD